MQITVNGEQKDIDILTARQLVEQMDLSEQAVAVELNGQIVPRRLQEETKIKDGDTIELVTLVGGG